MPLCARTSDKASTTASARPADGPVSKSAKAKLVGTEAMSSEHSDPPPAYTAAVKDVERDVTGEEKQAGDDVKAEKGKEEEEDDESWRTMPKGATWLGMEEKRWWRMGY